MTIAEFGIVVAAIVGASIAIVWGFAMMLIAAAGALFLAFIVVWVIIGQVFYDYIKGQKL